LEETSTLGRIVQDEDEDYRFRFPVMLPAEVGFVPLQLFVPPRARLTVKALRYGSKGATDLTGFAGVLRTIERFLSGIIKLVATRTERKLADERRTLENEALRQKIDADRRDREQKLRAGELKLVSDLIKVSKEAAKLPADDRQRIVPWVLDRERSIRQLVESKKLLSVSLSDGEESSGQG
jgi:hypothetical protein